METAVEKETLSTLNIILLIMMLVSFWLDSLHRRRVGFDTLTITKPWGFYLQMLCLAALLIAWPLEILGHLNSSSFMSISFATIIGLCLENIITRHQKYRERQARGQNSNAGPPAS